MVFFCFLLILNRFFFLFACSFSCVFACESFRLIYSKVWNPILPSATLLKYYIYGCIHRDRASAGLLLCTTTDFFCAVLSCFLLLLLRVEKYELSFCLSSYLSFEYNNIRNSKTLIIILFIIIYPFAVRFGVVCINSFISLFSVKGNTSFLDAENDVYQSVEIAKKKYIAGVTAFFFGIPWQKFLTIT